MENTNFWTGFEKAASIRSIGDGTVKIVKGPNADRLLARAALTQPVPNFLVSLGAQLSGTKKHIMRQRYLDNMVGSINGTVGSGGKGTRSYINQDTIEHLSQSLRNVVHHEGFHAKAPIIGSSEILAHIYGGLHDRKVKSVSDAAHNVGAAARDLVRLLRGSPVRAAVEGLMFSGIGLGAYKTYEKLTEED